MYHIFIMDINKYNTFRRNKFVIKSGTIILMFMTNPLVIQYKNNYHRKHS